MEVTVVVALLAAVAGSVGAYFVFRLGKRNTSGAIDTSDAAALWAEGGALRADLRNDLKETKARLIATNEALAEAVEAIGRLNEEIRRSRDEAAAAREESRLSREETRALKKQIEGLSQQTTELHEQTAELHEEVKTQNDLTIGNLADNAESRRILEIRVMDRTAAEVAHLRTAGERLPPEQAADQKKGPHHE